MLFMTLVLSPPRPSSGSKASWLLMCLLPLLMGCDAFRKAQTDPSYEPNKDGTLDEIQGIRVYDPELGRWVVIESAPKEKMDTIEWANIPETQVPPITSEGMDIPLPIDRTGGEKLNSYQIAVMLPFLTNRLANDDQEISNNVSVWSVNFYAGMQLAMKKLEQEGLSLNVSVMDTEASPALVDRMLNNRADIRNAQLIIGPYRRDNIRQAADFAKRENIVLVSPYSASDNLTTDNPNFIQVSPTLRTHCASLINHALSEFAPSDIVMVTRNVDIEKQCLEMMREAYFTSAGTRMPEELLNEYIIPHEEAPYEDIDLYPIVQGREEMAFVIPSWADETFIYSFLRELDGVRTRDQRIVVYGMPQWVNYQHIDYDYYERFQVRVSSNMYLDRSSIQVEDFQRAYFEEYGTLPLNAAYLGYDIALYFGRLMTEYGLNFQNVLDRNPAEMLHTRFNFQPVVDPTASGAENMRIERYENQHVNILEFRDYQFSRLDR